MSCDDLLHGQYEPFLLFHGYESIRHVVHPPSFRTEQRAKGLAVSKDGRVLRMVLTENGYHDRFVVEEDGSLVLVYVCGLPEERRRQHKNRTGDAVIVLLDRKSDDRHAVLNGTFVDIVAHKETKPDGTELLIPYSHIRIDAFETPGGPTVQLGTVEVPTVNLKKARTDAGEMEHLFFDTESAAPFDSRLLGRRHDAFPILQYAFVRTTADFSERVASSCEYVRYPAELSGKIGNDEHSSVLKFSCAMLQRGTDVHRVLHRLWSEIARVASTGGYVFAHNVRHDVSQLEKTASLVGFSWPQPLRIKTIDTVKVASNFVEGAQARWMCLGDLATTSRIQLPPRGKLHDAETDTLVMWQIVCTHFPPHALESYVEVYELGNLS